MTTAELMMLIKAGSEALQLMSAIAARASHEGRDPTPEEIEQVKARQADAEQGWQAALQRARERQG